MEETKKDAIFQLLRRRIVEGKYPDGLQLPQEAVFARELEVGKVTLRAALSRLEKEGLVRRIRSRGTFVIAPGRRKLQQLLMIYDDCDAAGSTLSYFIEKFNYEMFQRKIRLCQMRRTRFEALPEPELDTLARDGEYDAVIVLGSYFTGREPLVRQLHRLGLPVVVPHGQPQDAAVTGFAVVCASEQAGWYSAMHFMKLRNDRHLTLIGLQSEVEPDSIRSVPASAIRSFFDSSEAEWPRFEFAVPNFQSVYAAVARSIQAGTDAFLCYSDFFALLVLRALMDMRLRVPEDCALMGFSGFLFDWPSEKKLTTVRIDYEKLVADSIELLQTTENWFDPEYRPGPVLHCPCRLVPGDTA